MGRVSRRVVGELVVGTALAALVLGAGSAAAASVRAHARGCTVPHSRTVLSSALVRVYRVGSRFYGCLRRDGQATLLARRTVTSDGFGQTVFDRRALAGSWVAWTVGEPGPLDVDGGGTGFRTQIVAQNLRTGRKVRVRFPTVVHGITSDRFPDTLAVSVRGTLAWLTRDTTPTYGTSDTFVVLPAVNGRPSVLTLDNGGLSLESGQGDGTFSPPMRVVSANGALKADRPFAAADLNGDGITDLVLGTSDGVEIAPGRTDGTFAAPLPVHLGENPESIDIVDMDHDGHLDLVTSDFSRSADETSSTSHVLVSRGTSGFAFSPPVVTTLTNRMVVVTDTMADLDGDGTPDMLVTIGGNVGLALLHGNRDGTFSVSTTLDAHTYPFFALISDLNGDGIPDVLYDPLLIGTYLQPVGVLGRGGGQFAAPVASKQIKASSFAVGDVNGDGKPDIVVIRNSIGAVPVGFTVHAYVFTGHGDGTFTVPPHISHDDAGGGGTSLVDINGDGKLDVITGGFGGFTVMLNRGNGTFTPTKPGYDLNVIAPGRHTPRELVHAAPIDHRSLRFHGSTLTWTTNGSRTSQQVG